MPQTVPTPTLHIAFELSNKSWKLGFQAGEKRRFSTLMARDTFGLLRAIGLALEKFRLGADCRIVSCFEAGRDGFWFHHWLTSHGIQNVVVDPASMKVDRRARRRKTDSIDVRAMLKDLVRFTQGDKEVWSVVRVPARCTEDRQRLSRERRRMVKERTGHSNRIRSLLVLHGVDLKVTARLGDELPLIRLWDGSSLPPELCEEIQRELARWKVVVDQIKSIETAQRQALRANRAAGDFDAHDRALSKANMLIDLNGVGLISGWTLAHEFFWRHFNNRRQVGAAVGLTGTPFQSGDSDKEQGISKCGNRQMRALMIELAWSWIRFQPDSVITKWFNRRFGEGKRARKIGIVAVARRLAIALWHWVEHGVQPPGSILSTSAAVA